MQNLAKPLLELYGVQGSSQLPSAIFGSIGAVGRNLDTRERLRIGLWPIISEEEPETAMGIATLLAFLLERWQAIRVYRLFTQLEEDAADFNWSIHDSQFDIDDWDLEQLDENVAIWGTLEVSAGTYSLSVEIENDLIEDEEANIITITENADSLVALINALPAFTERIATELDAETALFSPYPPSKITEDKAKMLLQALFHWQNRLLLDLWGQNWNEIEIEEAVSKLVEIGAEAEDEMGIWAVTNALSHAMLPGYDETAETVSNLVSAVATRYASSSFAAIFLSNALFRLGLATKAYEMMTTEVAAHPENKASWIALGELYRNGGRYHEAADTLQQAIEAEIADATVYIRYVELIGTLHNRGLQLEEYVLIDPDEFDDETSLMAWEAIEGYEAALQSEPDNIPLLQRQCLQLIAVYDTERLWTQLEKLIALDNDGEATRLVIDALYPLEDLEPAIQLLKSAITKDAERPDLHINLAILYITNDEEERALRELDRAEELTDDPHLIAEMDRLFLIAEDPTFEAQIAELTTLVNSGGKLSSNNLEYLEDALERAPSLAELYVLLAKGYAARDEHEDALEVLMDGHREASDDPDILLELARILWQASKKDLAFEYLNKGLAANPNHVPLLAITGQYLFENDQAEEARTYLARAEAISPRSQALAEVKREISRLMSQDD